MSSGGIYLKFSIIFIMLYLNRIFNLFLSRCHCFTEMKRCTCLECQYFAMLDVGHEYNVIYYIGRIIKTKCLLQIEQPMMCTKTPEKVRVVRKIKIIIKAYIYIYQEHLARIICKAPVWYLCHYI
jgi:hypothetical protein